MMFEQDLFQPCEVGELVVSHVLEYAPEPTPDYEAMRRAIAAPLNEVKCDV